MNTKQIRLLISFLLVVAVALFFGLTSDTFFSTSNISQLLRDAAYVGTIAIGMSGVIISGNIDLSGGGIVCFAGCICAKLAFAGLPAIVCVLGAIVVGMILGYINSFLVNNLHIAPFVATLAAGFVYAGLGLIFAFRDSAGRIVNKSVANPGFQALGGKVGIIYYAVIVWVALALIMFFVQKKTKFGMHTYAVGSHEKSAGMSGVHVERTKAINYMICGAMCGVAAAFTVAYNGTATATLGDAMEFQAIAACVVGGIVMSGGSGNAIGALLGAIFMAMLNNGMLKYGLNVDWQKIVQGALIIVATCFDAQFTRITTARLRKKNQ
ncbi:MAG: ABC transporter permease [Oscillospiraceae bacterium]|nr:ABC transporter permease [Oscillospiraceae bacterium]